MVPIYEYQCAACGHRLEVMQRMGEDPLKTCPSCTENALKKLISKMNFQLKGTGWYETDFKNKGKPEAEKSGDKKGPGDKEGAKESKKDDAKKDKSADTKKSDSSESSKASTSTSED
jgi:putative FmdB family regulatory protein